MAGEKVNKSKNARVIDKPDSKKKKTEGQEPTMTLTSSQLQEFMTEAFQSALKQTQSVTGSQRKELEGNMKNTLTTRINKRNKEGQRFDQFLSDPNGPRKRIVVDRIYREYTGAEITATVNGNTVKVPVDGKPHLVHPAHYAAIKSKLEYLSSTRDRAVNAPDMFGDDVGDYQQVGQR